MGVVGAAANAEVDNHCYLWFRHDEVNLSKTETAQAVVSNFSFPDKRGNLTRLSCDVGWKYEVGVLGAYMDGSWVSQAQRGE